jgi:hypothetical protein
MVSKPQAAQARIRCKNDNSLALSFFKDADSKRAGEALTIGD